MWRYLLKAVLAVSSDPTVRHWVQRKARKLIDSIRNGAESKIANISNAVGLDPAPKPKIARLVRTNKDILHPGQVTIVDGLAIRIIRLISSNARETVYEGIEA